MLKTLKLKNFRSFETKEFNFSEKITIIVWDNWKWKSNILEAISLSISWESINNLPFEDLLNKNSPENVFFVHWEFFNDGKLIISDITYDKNNNKKKIFVNKKDSNKTKLKQNTFPIISFTPIDMNLMYLSPSLRRDFIKKTLWEAFPDFKKKYKDYENILKSRNILLKKIREEKVNKNEIKFWDKKFIDSSEEIYFYIKKLTDFYENNLWKNDEIFSWKFERINFNYIKKVDFNSLKKDIKSYLDKNLERDIILWRTQIWPHIDDFEILLDWAQVWNIASRWETKSVILNLKFLELDFIEKETNKKCILLIDDLISELDEIHKEILTKRIKNNQTIVASISPINWEWSNIINL